MKKISYLLGFCLLTFGLNSCSSDDVDNAACEVEEQVREQIVEEAISDFSQEGAEEGECQKVIDAIDKYRELECTADDEYATNYTAARIACGIEEITN